MHIFSFYMHINKSGKITYLECGYSEVYLQKQNNNVYTTYHLYKFRIMTHGLTYSRIFCSHQFNKHLAGVETYYGCDDIIKILNTYQRCVIL